MLQIKAVSPINIIYNKAKNFLWSEYTEICAVARSNTQKMFKLARTLASAISKRLESIPDLKEQAS